MTENDDKENNAKLEDDAERRVPCLDPKIFLGPCDCYAQLESYAIQSESCIKQLKEQQLSLLKNCQELQQEKENIESRFRDVYLMNKSLLQICSGADETEVQLDTESLLVMHAEQQYEIEQLQNLVHYQKSQVQAAMCFLQNVYESDYDRSGTGSATTIHDVDCDESGLNEG